MCVVVCVCGKISLRCVCVCVFVCLSVCVCVCLGVCVCVYLGYANTHIVMALRRVVREIGSDIVQRLSNQLMSHAEKHRSTINRCTSTYIHFHPLTSICSTYKMYVCIYAYISRREKETQIYHQQVHIHLHPLTSICSTYKMYAYMHAEKHRHTINRCTSIYIHL